MTGELDMNILITTPNKKNFTILPHQAWGRGSEFHSRVPAAKYK